MIREILDDRIAEQRQKEIEDADKARRRTEELDKALSAAETQISDMLKKAPVDVFKIPENSYPALTIEQPKESKGSFEKTYKVYVGYYSDASEMENTWIDSVIGDVRITLSYIFNDIDFSKMFADDNPVVTKKDQYTIFVFKK